MAAPFLCYLSNAIPLSLEIIFSTKPRLNLRKSSYKMRRFINNILTGQQRETRYKHVEKNYF